MRIPLSAMMILGMAMGVHAQLFHGGAFTMDAVQSEASVGQTVVVNGTYQNWDEHPDRHLARHIEFTVEHALGAAMSGNLLAAGRTVTVWRTNGVSIETLLVDGVMLQPLEAVTVRHEFTVQPGDDLHELLIILGHCQGEDLFDGSGGVPGTFTFSYGDQVRIGPRLRVFREGAGAVLRFPVRAGRLYTVEISENLRDWSAGLVFTAPTDADHSIPIGLDGPHRFFRLRQ